MYTLLGLKSSSDSRVVTRYMGSGIKGPNRGGFRDLGSQIMGSGSTAFFMKSRIRLKTTNALFTVSYRFF